MARSATKIETQLTGKDRVSKTFDNVGKKAKHLSKQMSGNKFSLGMAKSVAVGQTMFAMLSRVAANAVDAAKELGTLSDRAQQMQTSAVYLQQLDRAMGQVGINLGGIEGITKAFGKMEIQTGKVGAQGFQELLSGLAEMKDETARVTELSRIFGRSVGPALAPLLRQGPDAFKEGLAAVMADMPAVSESAVNTGDGIADAFSVASDEMKVAFQQSLGDIANWFEQTFGIGVGEGVRTAVIWLKWAASVGWEHFHVFGENIGKMLAFFVDDWKGALEWILNGVTSYVKFLFAPFKLFFESIKTMAMEFGKAFVKWVTGDEADWSGAWDRSFAKMKEGAAEFKQAWKDMAPKAPPGVELSKVNMSALAEQRETALSTMKKALAAHSLLVSGGAAAVSDVDDAAANAKKTIDDALKNAKYVSASSYDALKISLSSMRSSGTSAAVRNAVSGSSGTGREVNYMSVLREILGLQRDNVNILKMLGAV